MRVAVTGSNGLVGRRLVSQLVSAGHEVLGLSRGDRRVEGPYTYAAVDLADGALLTKTLGDFKPDAIINPGGMTDVDGCERLMTLTHAYPDREVELHLFVVDGWEGTPRGLDGQGLKWVALEALGEADLLEADRPFVEALQRRGPPTTINCCAAPGAARTAGA